MRKLAATFLVVLLASVVPVATVESVLPAIAQAQDASREAALILRILSYDRNLAQRATNGRVAVLIVYQQGNGASEAERSRVVTALNALGARTTVSNMQARAVEHAFRDRATLVQAARTAGATAIFVCGGLGGAAQQISQAAREARTLSMTSESEGVRRGGLGVGLVADGSQVRLVINLPAVEAEGARLDAAVLRLAEVIR
ncbi:YfiR/HmsC family protein [Sandaracinus amylolyticus]|uniref:Uncharacterized protein n=1 Tax=Sandaracinus amylolyticus TaxID=927083 RepID=A0A0F6W114_9BACT|nr:YfiR/HmsC family protein [Sandaracinus amylolyticus]AKF04750.1 hypothetical protein DB32_001899 [Sandaracinus amylolyticus]